MRSVGHRKTRPLAFSGHVALLVEGARFNDEIHRLPTGDRTFIRKGIYRFKTHDDANRHDLERIASGIAADRCWSGDDDAKSSVALPRWKTSRPSSGRSTSTAWTIQPRRIKGTLRSNKMEAR